MAPAPLPDEPTAGTTRPPLAGRARLWPKRLVFRAVRVALIGWARVPSRHARDAEPKVHILIVTAYGMGGTVRASLNIAEHLARHHRVEIVNAHRDRERPFFGAWPPGVEASDLDDRRPGAGPGGVRGRVRDVLRRRTSVLYHSSETRAEELNLWTDVQLVRKLRRSTGWLLSTRPGLNLVVAELAPRNLLTIGQEQMHLGNHGKPVRKAIARLYPRLDAVAVLTERDEQAYRGLVGDGVRMAVIPNTARPLAGPPADLSSTTVLAAGRFRHQKGFDMLLEAWAQVAPAHPDWRLRLCGAGHLHDDYARAIEELGIGASVSLERPVDMARAMSDASIFALSSRFEGFPLILLEAMSKGMGVVSFDCPTGPSEILDDHRNGILVPPNDVAAFAAGLRELIEDEDLRRCCAEAAIVSAGDYTMDAIGPRWDALVEGLWRERRGGPPPGRPAPGQPRAEAPEAEPAAAGLEFSPR